MTRLKTKKSKVKLKKKACNAYKVKHLKKAFKRRSGAKSATRGSAVLPTSLKSSRKPPKAVIDGRNIDGLFKLMVFGNSKPGMEIAMPCRVTFKLKDCTEIAMMSRPERSWLATIASIKAL